MGKSACRIYNSYPCTVYAIELYLYIYILLIIQLSINGISWFQILTIIIVDIIFCAPGTICEVCWCTGQKVVLLLTNITTVVY